MDQGANAGEDGAQRGQKDSPARGLRQDSREQGPGMFDVREHSLDPFPGSDVSARSRGKVFITMTASSSPARRPCDHSCSANLSSACRNRMGIACSSSIKNVGIPAWIA
jgi:hypothetical protein